METDSELFDSILEHRKRPDSNVVIQTKAHSQLVEMTWDVIGSFLTDSSSLTINDDVREKMEAISEYCTHNHNGNDKDNSNGVGGVKNNRYGGGCAILDVGCGDGSILSFLV